MYKSSYGGGGRLFSKIDGWLPLHHAVQHKAPPEVVQFLVAECPLALQEKTSSGFLPLHWAVHWEASVKVVRTLVDGFPRALVGKAASSSSEPGATSNDYL